MNINSLSFMPGFGFGMAATTLVGQSLGGPQGSGPG
jgi:Na+-driven multidrug efflux pump